MTLKVNDNQYGRLNKATAGLLVMNVNDQVTDGCILKTIQTKVSEFFGSITQISSE